ncbi:MAG TPA: DoxX family protein [Cyclobacteriaceae bacterium]|nr:DoxX family protein [Cyclobacteriaceae bacterium]
MTQTSSKRDTIIFWISTGLFCAMMLTSAIPNLLSAPDWVTIFEQLGFPNYLLPFLGVAKLLGVIALLVPGFNRIKEWAYAGFFFDLVGATYSALAAFGFDPQMLSMLVFFGLFAVSYIFHHRKIR